LPRLKLVSRAQVLRCKSGWSHGGPWEGLAAIDGRAAN